MPTVLLDLPLDVWPCIFDQLPWTCRLVCRAFRDHYSARCTLLKSQWLSPAPSHVASFQRLLAGLPSLTTLKCEGCKDVTDLTSLFTGKWCTRVVTLDLDGFTSVKDVACITAACARLQALSLRNFHDLADVAPLSKACQLIALDLSGCRRLTSIGPLKACPLLVDVSLAGCVKVHEISPLGACTRLTSLQLARFDRVLGEAPLPVSASTLPNLLDHIQGDTHFFNVHVLQHCVSLASLAVRGVYSLRPLTGMQRLTSLTLTSCDHLNSLEPLATCPQLTSLSLKACHRVTDLTPLQSCSRLAELVLSNHMRLVDLVDLAGCSALTALKLNSCQRLSNLMGLSSCPLLALLNLHGCSGITSLLPLMLCRCLTSLDISYCCQLRQDGSALRLLKHCPRLVRLNAAEARVHLGVLSSAAASLEHLSLRGCRFLDVADPLHHLEHFRQLTSLDLSSSELLDLEPLRLCSRLARLELRECCGLASLDALAALHGTLTALDCSRCLSLIDVTALARCSRLVTLSFKLCICLRDLGPIAGCTALSVLDLCRCRQLSNVRALAACQRLQAVQLDHCVQVRDVRPLLACRQLRVLNIDGCWRIVSGVSGLTRAGNVRVRFTYHSSGWRRMVRRLIMMGLGRAAQDA